MLVSVGSRFAEEKTDFVVLRMAHKVKRAESRQPWARPMQGETLRARFRAKGLWSEWTLGGLCALICALQSLPEELWARRGLCPMERAVMLGATSKRVRALLAGLQPRVPVAVRVVRIASMQSVKRGLRGLLAWCQVVTLEFDRSAAASGVVHLLRAPIGDEGARSLAGVLGQCSSLTKLRLGGNSIGHEGAWSLADLLRKCSSLAKLDLEGNNFRAEGARSLAEILGQCSLLAELNLEGNLIGHEGARSLARVLGLCSSLAKLNLGYNMIGAKGARNLAGELGQCASLTVLDLGTNGIGDHGAGSLARVLGRCSSLTALNLGTNGIGDHGAGSLARVLGQCCLLDELDLGCNGIGDEGARSLAGALGRCSSLKRLFLGENLIDDDGVAMLRESWLGDSGLFVAHQVSQKTTRSPFRRTAYRGMRWVWNG